MRTRRGLLSQPVRNDAAVKSSGLGGKQVRAMRQKDAALMHHDRTSLACIFFSPPAKQIPFHNVSHSHPDQTHLIGDLRQLMKEMTTGPAPPT